MSCYNQCKECKCNVNDLESNVEDYCRYNGWYLHAIGGDEEVNKRRRGAKT